MIISSSKITKFIIIELSILSLLIIILLYNLIKINRNISPAKNNIKVNIPKEKDIEKIPKKNESNNIINDSISLDKNNSIVIVNGVEIFIDDIVPPGRRGFPLPERAIDDAIDKELLYQEGKKLKINMDKRYIEMFNETKSYIEDAEDLSYEDKIWMIEDNRKALMFPLIFENYRIYNREERKKFIASLKKRGEIKILK